MVIGTFEVTTTEAPAEAGSTMSKIQELMQSEYFYLILAVIAVILVLILMRNKSRTSVVKQNEENQFRLNNLKSVPLPFDISRAMAMARVNKDIDDTVKESQGKFDLVQTNLKKLQGMIADSDEYVQLRKYGMAKDNNAEIAKLMTQTEKTVDELEKSLSTILEQENVQREKINDLKEIYHGIKLNINSHSDQYLFCWEALDGKINDIDHKFSEFETIMATSRFDQAPGKIEEIQSAIENLNNIVESIPELINVSKSEVPMMIEEVRNNYAAIKKQGAYLDHLQIPANLQKINDSLQDDLKKIKQCDIAEVNAHLLDCEKKLNQLKGQIDKENDSYKELLRLKEVTINSLNELNKTVENINANFNDLTERYGLNDYSDVLEDNNNKVRALNEQCHILMNNLQKNDAPASSSLLNLNQMNTEIVVCLNNINKMSETVMAASKDEKDAKEQLTKLSIVLNEVKAKITNNRIPSISDQYNNDLIKAEDYIKRLENQLKEVPINVSLVNSMKNAAVDFVSQLYESVNRILGTAIMAENAIVIGNMYRSTYPEIDSELTRAELAYRNGEYTQALTIALNTIRKVHPETIDELTKKKGNN
ncbi:MAG: hypothetical protein E7187_03105 [Erysipelotrichaceae bacterium]|nr:hypothetical protein [Erysipelotrichaceae bacterium]MBR2545444.1 hypothetical protein [Erysipelotrichaceae bacterium]MBR2701414.1 hypothetical protein [Erysipelotrichaceae bacterium]MBR2746010.1 hypothetical protein [Erysipelotrichaceae bacterium]